MDKKFLACLINTRDDEPVANTETEGRGKNSKVFSLLCLASCVFHICAFYIEIPGNLLVLVDQHAAHERVRLENLVAGKTKKQTIHSINTENSNVKLKMLLLVLGP